MISDFAQQGLLKYVLAAKQAVQDLHLSVSIILGLAVMLLLWRIWTFTILPALHPHEPKEIPYWVPVLGHALGFFRDSHGTLTRGRIYFGNTREPFAITVAGQKLYIITSSQDAAAVYQNTTSLTFDDYIRDVMVSFGGTPSAVEKMWQVPGRGDTVPLSPNPAHKTLAHLCGDWYRQQLHPGRPLDVLQSGFLHNIQVSLLWEKISDKLILSSTRDSKTVSLLGWCREVLLDSATRAFFGARLLELEPELLQSFFDFDDNSWKLVYKLPGVFSKQMTAAKQKSIDALTRYLQLPKEERPGEAWLVRTLEAEMRYVGIQEPDIAAVLMIFYWVINGNAYKLCFWILAYAIHDSELLANLRREVGPAVHGNSVDLEYLLDRCPKLDAVYNEVLRITASSSSVRTVTSATEVGCKTLTSGTVLLPCRQLHFDGDVFGNNAGQFDPERFLKNKDLSQSPSFKPFGGGTTYCPGRFLARREVVTFIALFLHRFHVILAPGPGEVCDTRAAKYQPFPKIEEMKPCLGIMGPAKGEDVRIRIQPANRE